MARIRQSIAYWAFNRPDLPFLKLCQEAKRIGYEGLEMVPEDHWEVAKFQGMKLTTHWGHDSLGDGLNKTANHDRIEREIKANCDKAAAHGIHALICFSGNRNGLSDEQGLANTVVGLKRVAGYAEQKGVTLVLELLNSRVDHKDYQCDRTSWGAAVVNQVGSLRVKLLYDIYHMQIMEGDVMRTIRTHVDLIGHFHTAGNPGRHELDETQELNYPAIMREVAATTYGGYVGQEFSPKGDPIAALEQAFAACNVG